jgi:hypothetical protein
VEYARLRRHDTYARIAVRRIAQRLGKVYFYFNALASMQTGLYEAYPIGFS